MSFSGSLSAAETKHDELERRLRNLSAQQISAEDALIVELARRLAPVRSSRPPEAVSEPGPRDTKPMQPLEMTMLRPSTDKLPDDPSEMATIEVEAKQASDFDDSFSHDPNEAELAAGWKLKISALALGGMVMIGVLIDLAQAPPGNKSPSGAFASAASISGGTPMAATVNPPFVAPLIVTPPPAASQFPDPQSVPTLSLRPDGTPIAVPRSATDSGMAAQTSNAAKPANPPPKAGKFTARGVVAKADTAAPAAAAEAPVRLAAPPKPEKTARAAPDGPQVAADPPTAPPAPHTPPQEPANPPARAFGELVGALAVPATSTRQSVKSTPANSGWAVQLAASKSETEAKSDAARLNARYASALNGAAIGVHKARANVATGYRLRVVGLSKAAAAALCGRFKGLGGDCFILKSVTTLISTSP